MKSTVSSLTIRFSTADHATYRVDLEGSDVGERRGPFAPPYTAATWQAIMLALEPGFVLSQADKTVQAALKPLGDIAVLPRKTGEALANALLANEEVRLGFTVALGRAEAMRRPLPVEMRFGAGCDALAALPWELLYYRDRFLLADTSIALSRYPEGAIPPTSALGELPLRVLLVLSEPVGASPIFLERAREELLHGLRSLDEAGAVVVDLLRPPTFSTLVEAVTNGGYHMLVFYGHGGYDPESGGLLLFEDEFGGPALIKASELGAALRNTDVRLVLLGVCQSATVADPSGLGNPKGLGIWSGTAPALVRAGVPLAIGMQVSMRVDAAQAFIRQFALSLAAGKSVIEAVGDARKPIIRGAYGEMWYAPALYGRPAGDFRLFDPQAALPANTAELRGEMKAARGEIERLEKAISGVGVLGQTPEMAHLRQARARFARARAEVVRRTPGGYAAVVSPLYGVPTNPIFVGRTQELHDVAQAFAGGHPVLIWGTGGIGKSALAAEVAHRQSWRFPGGVLWLDCRGGPAFDSLLNQIGAFAGIEAIDKVEPDKKETTVKWALAALDARCLLVWDNAEDVWGERFLRRFVESLPANCQALLTTRENPEQAMWPTVELAPLSGQAMHDLFYRLASAAGVKAGSQADLDAIPLILDWLQGHPLALALVVPLAMKRGLQRVWADLQAHPLKGIEAAFEVSYERLTDLQRRVFTRLSVYTIPFDWPAAEALLPGEADVDDALDALVQRTLVGFDGTRYSYHALLRQYAYKRLSGKEDTRAVHRLAAEHLKAKLTAAHLGTLEEGFEQADQWECAGAWKAFVEVTHELVCSLDQQGHAQSLEPRLQRASVIVEEHLTDDLKLRAMLLHDRASVAWRSANWEQAISYAELAIAAYERVPDELGLASTYTLLGLIYVDKYEFGRAKKHFRRSLTIAKRLNDMHGVAVAYNNLGLAYYRDGELDRALEYYKKAQTASDPQADLHLMAQIYGNLGSLNWHRGDLLLAQMFYVKSFGIQLNMGAYRDAGMTLCNLGMVYAIEKNWQLAIESYRQSLAVREIIGDFQGMAQTYNNLGLLYADRGEWDLACKLYEKSLAICAGLGDYYGTAAACGNLGTYFKTVGDTRQAAAYWASAYFIFVDLNAEESEQAAANLIEILGSVEAANDYLAQLPRQKEP